MSEDKPTMTVRLPRSTLDALGQRTRAGDRGRSRAVVVRDSLARYHEICRRHRPDAWLGPRDIAICCAALVDRLSTGRGDASFSGPAQIRSAIEDAVGDPSERLSRALTGEAGFRDSPNLGELKMKLGSATYAELIALVDLAERRWANDDEDFDVRDGFVAVSAE